MDMMSNYKKIKSYYCGKAASYMANAIADKKISRNLEVYIAASLVKEKDRQILKRTNEFINDHNLTKSDLMIISYVYYYCNGLMDYWFAKLLFKLFRFEIDKDKDYEDTLGKVNPFVPWTLIVLGKKGHIEKYSKELGQEFSYDSHKIKKFTKIVQDKNIRANLSLTKDLEANVFTTKRSKIINKYLKRAVYKDIFVKSAIKTQHSAIFWDKIFKLLLR